MYDVCMNTIQFTWDENKNRANRRKHGVSFEEADKREEEDYWS